VINDDDDDFIRNLLAVNAESDRERVAKISQHLSKLAVRIIAAILLTYSGQQPICCHLMYSVDLLARCCKRQLSLILTGLVVWVLPVFVLILVSLIVS